MVGDIPKVNSSAVERDSIDSSPEARSYKRPKIDNELAVVKVEVEDELEQGSSGPPETTTAYTLSAKDQANLRIITLYQLELRLSNNHFRQKPLLVSHLQGLSCALRRLLIQLILIRQCTLKPESITWSGMQGRLRVTKLP